MIRTPSTSRVEAVVFSRHRFDATRTSPFGHYATCSCGWTSPAYVDSHEAAWHTWQAHRDAMVSSLQHAASVSAAYADLIEAGEL